MQAVILAGGKGSRLWPITKDVPKAMVPVASVPYLEHQMRLLSRQNITNVVLLTGHLGEKIEGYFGDGGRWGLSIQYSRETDTLGTGGALREARHLLQPTFLLIYGDSYLPIRYRSAVELMERSVTSGVLVVYDNRLENTSVRNNVAIDNGGYVVRYDKRSLSDPAMTYVDAGVLALRKHLVDRIPSSGQVSLEEEVFPKWIAARDVMAFCTEQRFFDMGTTEGLRVLRRFLSSRGEDG